jgi:acyl-CoA thioesterase FadM
VRASCEYRLPLLYMDEVEIELTVREKKKSTLAYDFVFRRVADRNGPTPPDEVALGMLQVVHVARERNGRMKAAPMPEPIARSILVAPRT